jgi:hypothetical protein
MTDDKEQEISEDTGKMTDGGQQLKLSQSKKDSSMLFDFNDM